MSLQSKAVKEHSAESICKGLEEQFELARAQLEKSDSSASVEELRVKFLGKKGSFSEVMAQMRSMGPDEKRHVGQTVNRLKSSLSELLDSRKKELERRELDEALLNDRFDTSIPGIDFSQGSRHPLSQTMQEAVEIFRLAGLEPVYGPEVEFEEYNFDRMNFKAGHAARDMQATFFVESQKDSKRPLLLRTHTSPVQARVLMEAAKNGFSLPIRVQAPGRVYRVDDDATHAPMFHQIEGLAVDHSSGMGDLKAVLDFFFRKFFDRSDLKVRFRPSYFPFTEPSAEVDISCLCGGDSSCRVCKGSFWLEVAGAGLVHPEVFKACDWDPQKVQGWAFGMGVERLAMLKLGITDLRLFLENRMSFLRAGQ